MNINNLFLFSNTSFLILFEFNIIIYICRNDKLKIYDNI